ncbi:MAG: uracil-DNA glycosylase [Patescibacteria group bacterium]
MHKEKLLEQLARQIIRCKLCRLYRTRHYAVPGVGDSNAQICFVGEGPGYNEDQQGKPFVGRAGDLLEMLLRSIGTRREKVWISNVVKCRPPENRNPMVDEVRTCKAFLIEQLKAIGPKMIIPLGRYALEHFLPDGKISRDHGKPFYVSGKIIYPLYHPAAALRSEKVLLQLKAEFRRIPAILKMDKSEMKVVGKKKDDENQMSLI